MLGSYNFPYDIEEDDEDTVEENAELCHRLDVTTGRDVETTPIDVPGNRPITVGRDGKRWFVTSYVGHVTRHVITNFGARPWK